MRRPTVLRFLAALTSLAVATIGATSPAAADTPWLDEDDVYTEVTEDFCDVPGLTVELVSTSDSRSRWVLRGPDRLPHRMEHTRSVDVYTNLDTGEIVTDVGQRNENMMHTTDNGDGTLTFTEQLVFKNTVYSEDGSKIGHRTGRLIIELVFAHAGTPQDPDDDEFVSIRVPVFHEHGDDFCATAVAAIG